MWHNVLTKLDMCPENIDAQQCSAVDLSYHEIYDFLVHNTLSIPKVIDFGIGLKFQNILVSCLSLYKNVIVNVCTKVGISLHGHLTKMLNECTIKELIVFCDLRYEDELDYPGFEIEEYIEPKTWF